MKAAMDGRDLITTDIMDGPAGAAVVIDSVTVGVTVRNAKISHSFD